MPEWPGFASGGFKAGHIHGTTDELGHHAVEKKVAQHDSHATPLHLFGLDAKKLVYSRTGSALSLLNERTGRPGDRRIASISPPAAAVVRRKSGRRSVGMVVSEK